MLRHSDDDAIIPSFKNLMQKTITTMKIVTEPQMTSPNSCVQFAEHVSANQPRHQHFAEHSTHTSAVARNKTGSRHHHASLIATKFKPRSHRVCNEYTNKSTHGSELLPSLAHAAHQRFLPSACGDQLNRSLPGSSQSFCCVDEERRMEFRT